MEQFSFIFTIFFMLLGPVKLIPSFGGLTRGADRQFKRDVAITDKITPTITSSTLIVRWGQRGRVGETSVKPRVDQVVAALAPWVLTADANAVTNLPAPIPMRTGESWAANLCLPSPCVAPSVQALSIQPFDAAADRALLMRAIRAPGVAVEQARAGGVIAGHWTPNERILRRVHDAVR